MTARHAAVCMIEGCTNRSRARGLCGNCYTVARYAIQCGKTTWEYLERHGLSRRPPVGIGARSIFTEQLRAVQEEEARHDS